MRKLLAILVLFGIFLAVYALLRPAAPPSTTASSAVAATQTGDLSASSVLRINPRTAHPAPSAASPVKSAPMVTPDIAQLRQRKAWAELHARVSSGPKTPEALYIQAEIYSRCAKRPPAAGPSSSQAEAREKFIATLKGDPSGEQRIAAYEKSKADPCEGLALGEFSK